MQRVGVVIVNFHGERDTRGAVASALESRGAQVEVVIIDNEGDGDWARQAWAQDSRVAVIANSENVGFGAACNQGIALALEHGADCVCLLNNDAWLEADTLAILAEAAKVPGMAAPRILDGEGRIYSAGGLVEPLRARCRNRGYGEADRGQYEAEARFEFCSGCALMFTRKALESGERFHEPYFLYYEDADLCLRLARRGFAVQYAPRAVAHHREGSSTPAALNHRLVYYNTRNRWLFLKRNARGIVKFGGWKYLILITLLRAARWAAGGQMPLARAAMTGLRDGMAGRLGINRAL